MSFFYRNKITNKNVRITLFDSILTPIHKEYRPSRYPIEERRALRFTHLIKIIDPIEYKDPP